MGNILDIVSHYSMKDACFVTLNTRDFSDVENKDSLHQHLKNALKDKGIDLSRVHYFTSLKAFIEKEVKPKLRVIEEHEGLIATFMADKLGFMEPLEETLIQKILGLELAAYDIVIIEEGENHSVNQVEEVSEIEDISEISTNEYLFLFVHRHCAILVSIFLSPIPILWMILDRYLLLIAKGINIQNVDDAYADCPLCPY